VETTSDLDAVLRVLDLEPTDGGFIGSNLDASGGVVFGGQILGQTVVAAARTQPAKEVQSVHTIFARSARGDEALMIDVEEMHGGRAFGSVTVTVRQGDRICARSLVLLHAPDPDLIRHAAPAPEVAEPDGLEPRGHTSWWDIRYDPAIDIGDPIATGPATLDVWTRFPGAPDDLVTSQALLAYASDGFLIGTAMRPHRGVGQSMAHVSISTTVLTQTLSFHDPFSAGDWLLLAHESPYAGRGRSYGMANVFTADGRMVASFVQDNMVRDFPEGQAPAEGTRAAH
jgi:acyl-CoA thioesterase